MKKLSAFLLSSIMCCQIYAPMVHADSPIGGPGPAFANSGGLSGNRTAFTGNVGAMNNNQWNTLMNPNPLGQGAVADFGNCNSLILRCAAPKCAGCNSMELALPIVNGCVQSNPSCKQYGDALVQTLAAQMVSNANAKASDAAAMAAQSAADEAAAQSAAQMQQMQSQMMQMQQQMQAQSEQSAMAVQMALEEQKQLAAQQAANAAAMAQAAAPDTAIQSAAAGGVSADVLAREQAGGRIMTQLENAEVAIKDLKNTMQNVFSYARCDANGNNCEGPRRVKAFKQKANQFFDPYEAVLDEVYDALILAQTLGVDITDIYMMLNGSCNVWGKYMCETCKQDDENCDYDTTTGRGYYQIVYETDAQGNRRVKAQQPHCTLLNMLNNQEDVQQNWLDMDAGSSGGIRVACASDAIDNSMLFRGRKKQATIDIETLRRIIAQDAPAVLRDAAAAGDAPKWCQVSDESQLEIMTQQRKLPGSNLCVKLTNLNASVGMAGKSDCEENEYINSAVALCSTHAYNIGETSNPKDAATRQRMNDVVALKSTIITQQMKKQYDFLDVTLKRFKTQLEKAILAAKVQAAGGVAEGSSSGGVSRAVYLNCGMKGDTDTIVCVRQNLTAIQNEIGAKSGAASINTTLQKQLKTEFENLKAFSNSKLDGKTECDRVLDVEAARRCMQTMNGGMSNIENAKAQFGARSSRDF
jgi:hypothetical protein